MQNDFWDKLYVRVLEDYELLKLIALDTSSNVLLKLVRPNKPLYLSCARFIKKGKITNKDAFVDKLLAYGRKDEALRRIILFTWVEDNKTTLSFLTLGVDKEVMSELNQGKFGNEKKIEILSKIDLRDGVDRVFQRYFEAREASVSLETEKTEDIEPIKSPDKGLDSEKLETALLELEKVKDSLTKQEQLVENLTVSTRDLKRDNKELREQLEQRLKEYSGLTEKFNKQQIELKEKTATLEELSIELTGFKVKLEFAEKELETLPKSSEGSSFDEIELRSKLSGLLEENKGLRKAVENRENSIKRLEKEITRLTASLNKKDERNARVENLQTKLKEVQERELQDRLVGYLIDSELFLTLHAVPYNLDKELVRGKGLVFEELCVLTLDEGGEAVGIESLESGVRREVVGVVRSEQGEFYLECEEEKFEIRVGLSAKFIGRPARGVFLPEAGARAEGIYRVDHLDSVRDAVVGQGKQKSRPKEAAQVEKIFAGERVLIIGGDRVGHSYEQALEPYGLEVVWRSGFEGFKELRGGMGSFDGVVLIVRQMSHTLLREVVGVARREAVELTYCTKRGTSGVLGCLDDLINKN